MQPHPFHPEESSSESGVRQRLPVLQRLLCALEAARRARCSFADLAALSVPDEDAEALRSLLEPRRTVRTPAPDATTVPATVATRAPNHRPHWDAALGELWWRGTCVKQFRHEAANQRRLLDGFEKEGWPALLLDPLPVERGVDAKKRLRETVKALIHGQHPLRLCFRMDGTGQAVRWSLVPEAVTDTH